jgi:hypothetical protein
MITIFATFRPFNHAHFGLIQRNAIGSWLKLNPKPQILVMGNEQGSKEICEEFQLTHVPDIAVSEYGTPMIDDMFKKAQELTVNNLLLLTSCDIILFQDNLEIANVLLSDSNNFMATLRRSDAAITEPINFEEQNWEEKVKQNSTLGHPGAGDFFLFPKTFYSEGIPPFTIGRASVDNWLIYEAVRLGKCVDLTAATQIIHQNHDHSHVGGFHNLVNGEEFKINRKLGEGKMLEIINSNWIMTEDRKVKKRK